MDLTDFLKKNNIQAMFHYQVLHKSHFYIKDNPVFSLPNAEFYSDCLLRLPLFPELTGDQINYVTQKINAFYS